MDCKKNIKVTIGLLVYNHEKYIDDALQGLLCQEGEDIQLIILDDASTDGSVNIIQGKSEVLERNFAKVEYIYHNNNTGNISKNCNEIIIRAKGDLIWIIAGDDIMLDGAVKHMRRVLEREKECSVAYGNMIRISDNYKYRDDYGSSKKIIIDQECGIQSNLFRRLMMQCEIPAPAVMMRRELFERYGLHDENILFEDYEYWLRLSRTEKFYFEDYPTVLYRQSINSVSTSRNGDYNKKMMRRIMVDYAVREKYEQYLSEEERRIVWQAHFNYSFMRCKETGYFEGIDILRRQQREKGVLDLDERQTNYKTVSDRLSKGELIIQWMAKEPEAIYENLHIKEKVETVAIYGYSRLGRALKLYLEKYGIEVKYIIDQKGQMLRTDKTVYTLNDDLEDVDAVIITPIGLYEEIKSKLEKKLKSKFIYIETLIAE